MGNLMAEEDDEPLSYLKSHVKLKQHFLTNLILTEIQFNYHIDLAVAPSRISIRLLDDDLTAHSLLQLPLVLAHTENFIRNISKSLIRRLSNKLQTYHLG
ncbi:hypothetical protein AVEN_146408-1 [Araneus ventricosus]|uniref:Uncharacterized protein n=1 Tax=Araneus ventricosus TaxID=182803 RepID=A0A4Y2TXY3_ARAVE|nr:hypothetical protein AVEN_146408-1 [Araneus ventricosus]